MKRWRRPLILIALLLVAGAVVNVAVAWGIAGLGEHRQPTSTAYYGGSSRDPWQSLSQSEAMVLHIDGRGGVPRAAPWHVALVQPPRLACTIRVSPGYWQCWEEDFSRSRFRSTVTFAVGWPYLALRSSSTFPYPSPMRHRLFARTLGEVPLSPIAPGFLLNTLFYTAILALPLSFFPIRRRLRARRGRCPKCGYDLAGLHGVAGSGGEARNEGAERGGEGGEGAAPCPECGAEGRLRQGAFTTIEGAG